MVNKQISKHVGVEAALLLADLISKEAYFAERGEIDDEGFFFNTAENIENDTTLSYHIQKKCLRALFDAEFIFAKLKGVPAKLHYKILKNKISNFLNTEFENIPKQDPKKVETNKNKSNKNKSKKNNNVDSSLFTGDEIKSIPEQVILYLNECKGGSGFKLVDSNFTEIKTRIKEGYKLEDFKKVIDSKIIQWLRDDKNKMYLRPETLFGKKMNGYLEVADTIINKAVDSGSNNFEYNPQEEAQLK